MNTNEPIVILLKTRFRREFSEVDIKLKDGREFYSIVIEQGGKLLGKAVGGHTGIDKTPLPFSRNDILAYRPYWGFLARLGMRSWRSLQ